jgi:hypothetical protein
LLAAEDLKLQALKDRHEQDMKSMREQIQEDMKQRMSSIEQAQKETQTVRGIVTVPL